MILLDTKNKKPLYIQLYEQLKDEILNHYKIGDKIPSIRKLSNEYSVSKNTVETAFGQLYAEGYIESREKVGYFVSDLLLDLASAPVKKEEKVSQKIEQKVLYNFYPARLSHDSFPLKTWKRLFIKAMDEELDFGEYGEGQGQLGLRQEIARYLESSRGVVCESAQIIVTSGFADSMGLLSEILKDRHSALAIERPGYYIASKTFEEHAYDIVDIEVKRDGLDIEALEKSSAKIVYITPSHQYPTGVIMPIANRNRLIKWARQQDGYIIEDDYDSELNYTHRPIPSLQGLDKDDRVIYVGTFSKSLSPALRVGYMVLPKHLVLKYKSLFHAHFSKVSLTTQKTLELFMREGHWERHLRKIRTLNKKKHDLMLSSLREHFKDEIRIVAQGGGLSILIRPTFVLDLHHLRARCMDEGIKLYLASDIHGDVYEAIRMGFGGLSFEEITQGVKHFKEVWDKQKKSCST